MEADPDVIDFVKYRRTDMAKAAPDFWDSLEEARKQEFLTVSASDLDKFSCLVVQEPWLVDFLADAIAFSELHGTWEMYLCPDQDCLRLFQDDESLINHLKCEHFPEIHPVVWPPRRHNLAEERRCADALRKKVWKPIVVEAALDMLSSMCLHYQHVTMADVCTGSDQLNSLDWVYSEDLERKALLVELGKEFQVLLAEHEPASFALLSDGYFMTMMALASKHIFIDRPPRYNTQFLQGLLARSPLSFCLLEAADLYRFVELVKTMSQFVKQATLPSENQEFDSIEGDVSWSKSDILDVLSFSPNENLFNFYEAEPLCSGDKVSILSLLCNGPCIPSIPRVPSKACECFSSVQKVLDELRVPVIVNCIEPPFQSERNHLQIVNRVQFMESQLRQLCALDCRMYILPLMISFLRLKLYFYWRYRQLKAREENPAAQCPTIPCHEDHIEQNVRSESEYDSDSESYSENDSDLDEKPWRDDLTLCSLGSTLSKSATGETEGSGPFFWMEISDVLRHCEKNRCDVGCESVREGIRRFRLNKTWKYWLCYRCDRTFIDRESHMVHLENEHQLCIDHNEYWLIPQQDSRDEGDEFRQDVVKRESGLEESVTLDHNYDCFLVDSTKFYKIPSADEKEQLGQTKGKEYLEIVHNLHNHLSYLTRLFQIKRKNLTYFEVVNALGLMLFNGGQPLSLLVSWLRNLSTVEWRIGTTHKLQFQFLSQLLNKAHDQGYGPLGNYSVLEAFKDVKLDLISELYWKDQAILRAVDQIDDMKCCLSDLCVCDYRTEIVPPVRSFLHAKFKFDNNLRSLKCNNVKEFLSTLDELLVQGRAYFFRVVVLSPGRMIINAMENKSSWAFAFIGIRLSFVGKWFDVALAGSLNFGWWSNWGAGLSGRSASVKPEDSAVIADWHNVKFILCEALSHKLLSLVRMYGEQISF